MLRGWAEFLGGLQTAWARLGNWTLNVPPPVDLGSHSSLGAQLVITAKHEIGNGEVAGGNNRGPDIDRYRAGKGGSGSWCAAFVSWCLEQSCKELQRPMPVTRSHGAKQLWRRAAKAGAAVKRPQAGDLVAWHRGPVGGWQVLANLRDEVLVSQAKSEDERAQAAEACVLRLNFRMPMLLDRLSNEVDRAYSALPERLYVIDPTGTIAWRSGPGPFGFDVDGWKRAIEEQAPKS